MCSCSPSNLTVVDVTLNDEGIQQGDVEVGTEPPSVFDFVGGAEASPAHQGR